VIKAYTKGGVSAYEKFYKFDKNKNIFLPYKICQYTYDGKKKFEYYIKTKKSLFYFYYKNNEWVVYYNENKGKIDWGLY
jgi:hypothetical protein